MKNQEIIPEKPLMTINPSLRMIMDRLSVMGYKALIVGGAVRDAILGIEPKDFDIEVYNVSYGDLEAYLSGHGKVDLVGKSFGIIKFKPEGSDETYDFSIPRKENRIGVGHKAFEVTFDPAMTIKDGASRRDLTINALAYDPIENKIYDYFGGMEDLKNKIIRHTSDAFREDALRILRCMQFQARFDFTIHPDTIQLMKEIVASRDFESLPKERIFEEFMKWAEKGIRHDLIFQFLRDTNLIDYYPELKALKETLQDKIYHPEGDVEIHTVLCLAEMDKVIAREKITGQEKAILVMAILLHDIGKPATTEEIMKLDKTTNQERPTITSHGHEALGGKMSIEFLSRLGFHEELIKPISNLVSDHLASVSISCITARSGKLKAVKRLSRRLNPATIQQLLYVIEADHNGRGSDMHKDATGSLELLELAKEVKVDNKQYEYILMGRHLMDEKLKSGPIFGKILRTAEEAQENGMFQDLEGAKMWLRKYLSKPDVTIMDADDNVPTKIGMIGFGNFSKTILHLEKVAANPIILVDTKIDIPPPTRSMPSSPFVLRPITEPYKDPDSYKSGKEQRRDRRKEERKSKKKK